MVTIPPVDFDLGGSVILPRQYVATVVAHQLSELPNLDQREVFIDQKDHPVLKLTSVLPGARVEYERCG